MTAHHGHPPTQPHHRGHGSHGGHVPHPRRPVRAEALPARFRLHAPHAKKVLLVCGAAGAQPHPMHRSGDGYWHLTLELKRGRYEYYFVVDDQRQLDPKSRGTITHADGTRYSVIEVGY